MAGSFLQSNWWFGVSLSRHVNNNKKKNKIKRMYSQKPYISNTTYECQKYLPYTVNDALPRSKTRRSKVSIQIEVFATTYKL